MTASVDGQKREKAPYSAPKLTVYGSVKKLTAAGTGAQVEGTSNAPSKKP